MGVLRTFINRPVTTVMMVLVFVVLGFVSYNRMVVDLFPELDFPLVQIVAVYPGAGPDEIESQIIKKIEDEVSNISDIKEITSHVYEGYGWIVVEFNLGVDIDIKALDVKDKVEAIKRDLPDAAEDPVVTKFDPLSMPVIDVALTSNNLNERDLYELVDKKIKDYFSQVSGVAKVELIGGTKRQINVYANMEKLLQYDLTPMDLVRVLGQENFDIPAGTMDTGRREVGVRFKGEVHSVDELKAITFNAPHHGVISLADVARIEDGGEKVKSLVRYKGTPAVLMRLYKRSDGNAVQVAQKARERMKEISASGILPPGTALHVANDTSTFIVASVKNARDNILLGIVLCSLLLFFFLGNLRLTLVAVVVLPTSIISAFLLMDFSGFTINVMTLMALGISIGALVANAIVVLENISRHLEQGKSPKDAARMGTAEIAVAVLASAGTNIVVFTPIAFMGGIVGQFFFQFGLTVVFATIFSLLASFSLTPMLAALLVKPSSAEAAGESSLKSFIKWPLKLFNSMVTLTERAYTAYLWPVLRHPYLVVLLTIGALIGSFMLFRWIGGEFFPASDRSLITISAQLPKGATKEAALEIIKKIEHTVQGEIPEAKDYTVYAGGETVGFDEVNAIVRLVKPQLRKRSDRDIFYDIQPSLARISGAEILVLGETPGRDRADFNIDLYGPDYSKLIELSKKMRETIMSTGNFRAVFNRYREPKEEIHFYPDPYRRAHFKLPNAVLGLNLRYGIEGEKAAVLRVSGEEYDIKVRYDQRYRDAVNDLQAYRVPIRDAMAPLNLLGKFKRARGISDIERKNKRRLITLECFISEKSMNENVAMLDKKFRQMDIPKGYSYVFSGVAERQRETSRNIQMAFIMAIILTYMLLAAILNSLIHPVTIMITVPLGLIGVILTLFFTGITMNLMSMMAIVMLVGIVVNNAILIIDYILQQINTCSESLEECIIDGARTKFRAILMTNLAIIAGIFPQVLGGEGGEFMIPMAAATMGGVAVSTLFTLFTIPALFLIIERLFRKIKGLIT